MSGFNPFFSVNVDGNYNTGWSDIYNAYTSDGLIFYRQSAGVATAVFVNAAGQVFDAYAPSGLIDSLISWTLTARTANAVLPQSVLGQEFVFNNPIVDTFYFVCTMPTLSASAHSKLWIELKGGDAAVKDLRVDTIAISNQGIFSAEWEAKFASARTSVSIVVYEQPDTSLMVYLKQKGGSSSYCWIHAYGMDTTPFGHIQIATIGSSPTGVVKWTTETSKPTGALPIGTIVLWWGAKLDIPLGWAACDGSTLFEGVPIPDLRDKFVVGARSDSLTGEPQSNVAGALLSNGGSAFASLAESNLPSHTHNTAGAGITGLGGGYTYSIQTKLGSNLFSPGLTAIAAGDAGGAFTFSAPMPPIPNHTHSVSFTGVAEANLLHTATPFSITPPFRALWYIMRVF